MGIRTKPLVEVVCNDCHDAYFVLGADAPKHLACYTLSTFFLCRRCRLFQLGEYVEKLIEEGPEHFGMTVNTQEESDHYNRTFFGAIEEMYSHLMGRNRR